MPELKQPLIQERVTDPLNVIRGLWLIQGFRSHHDHGISILEVTYVDPESMTTVVLSEPFSVPALEAVADRIKESGSRVGLDAVPPIKPVVVCRIV